MDDECSWFEEKGLSSRPLLNSTLYVYYDFYIFIDIILYNNNVKNIIIGLNELKVKAIYIWIPLSFKCC